MTMTDTPGDMQEAVTSYADACRARIPGFVARHFGWRGSLRLHRTAVGLDLLRAPLNVLLVGPTLFLRLAGLACRWLGWRRLGTWLARRNLFVETNLARRMADLVVSELLRLDDAPWAIDPEARQRIRELIAEYLAARNAVAEFAAGVVAIGVGIALVQALTPSAITLGPLLAREFAQSDAIDAFWLGPWAGAIWYGWYPADASWGETILTTATVMGCFALIATFMGLITDPLLHAAGLASASPRPCGRHAGARGAGRSRGEPGAARPLCCPAHRPGRRAPVDHAHDALMSSGGSLTTHGPANYALACDVGVRAC